MYLTSVSGFLLFTSTFSSVLAGSSNPCRPNPCENGGTCTSVSENYTCNCNPGYAGENCESVTSNPCRPNPCENGGTCSSVSVDYTCNCNPGYTGENCESEAQETIAQSSLPPGSTEEDANRTILSTSSSPVAVSVTHHQIVSSQSSSYVIVSATKTQSSAFPSSVSSAVFTNATTSQMTVPPSNNFFEEEINIAIVASLGAIVTATLSSVACYKFVKRKSETLSSK